MARVPSESVVGALEPGLISGSAKLSCALGRTRSNRDAAAGRPGATLNFPGYVDERETAP